MEALSDISKRIARWLHLEHWQLIMIYLIVYDVIMVSGAYFLALWLRFDFRFSAIPEQYLVAWQNFTPIYSALCFAVFWRLGLYKSIWRFASFSELFRVTLSSIVTAVLHTVLITVLFRRMPISYYVLGAMFQFCFVLGIRFSYRFLNIIRNRWRTPASGHRVMIIGAGQAGQMIIQDMRRSPEVKDQVVCIIDDNRNKWGRTVDGISIVGGRDDILASARKYEVDKIYVAIPSATKQDQRDILNICKETGCELKTLPGIYQLINGEVSLSSMKDVDIADLLGRDQIQVDLEEILESLRGKTILVTGGGGSIGSELCRQIARHEPGLLVIFDIYENNAYEIEQELKRELTALHFVVEIGSVRDSRRVNQIFDKYHPDYVYHAAAHKHVPLMETSPCEA
ncbi:MAG: polysaccharide biosynthesis protein, partial [Clostridia bacterium]|nr:polysaccharide biosynthesis protein [Clostridia bacterium]